LKNKILYDFLLISLNKMYKAFDVDKNTFYNEQNFILYFYNFFDMHYNLHVLALDSIIYALEHQLK